MDQHAKLPKPVLIEKLRLLVAEKKKAQALKAMPVKREPIVVGTRVGRNDPCTCGSGKKYKKCCLLKEEDSIQNTGK